MNIPRATYRVQLTPQFRFSDAASILPYLASLGVSTIYCSPVLQARRGSMHGYDTTDPTRLSEQLGGEAAWSRLCQQARLLGMTILLDIVPNHMAASLENLWWIDVLANGRLSPFATFFDIDWSRQEPSLKNRVVLPILDRPLKNALADGVVRLSCEDGKLSVKVGEQRLPASMASCGPVLRRIAEVAEGTPRYRMQELASQLLSLPPVQEDPPAERHMEYSHQQELARQMRDLLSLPSVSEVVPAEVAATTPRQLRQCLRAQAYVLVFWKKSARVLNYRRFFDINDLVGVRVEDPEVFEATHERIRALAEDDVVCGFRVDHIDGLRDPQRYLERLRSLCPTDSRFTVVEKILTGEEMLSASWPIEGTTGYEFLSMVNGLFVDPKGLRGIARQHRHLGGIRASRHSLVYRNKRRVIKSLFPGELDRLVRLLQTIATEQNHGKSTSSGLRGALIDTTARLSAYRTYLRPREPVADHDMARIHAATEGSPSPEKKLLRDIMAGDLPTAHESAESRAIAEFVARWQQTTGAVMAKGFEDTTLYQDTTLLSLNDVGSRPDYRVATVDEFHEWNRSRLKDWPHTLNCTATHDTKRGEDVRARLNVLTAIPDEWAPMAQKWMDAVRHRAPLIDAAMALLVLQTIVATWPAEDSDVDSLGVRVKEYVVKVAREAKTHSSWSDPQIEYERSAQSLVDIALTEEDIRSEIERLGAVLQYYGSLNSLSQTLLKITCPGIPDFYQGSELWDLSMVDPDNRRQVDYNMRHELLASLEPPPGGDGLEQQVKRLATDWPSPLAKLFVTHRALEVRRGLAATFETGEYVPLRVSNGTGNACAFARVDEIGAVIVLVPVRTTLQVPPVLPRGESAWGSATIELPAMLRDTTYTDALTGLEHHPVDYRLSVARLTRVFPLCLLVAEQ